MMNRKHVELESGSRLDCPENADATIVKRLAAEDDTTSYTKSSGASQDKSLVSGNQCNKRLSSQFDSFQSPLWRVCLINLVVSSIVALVFSGPWLFLCQFEGGYMKVLPPEFLPAVILAFTSIVAQIAIPFWCASGSLGRCLLKKPGVAGATMSGGISRALVVSLAVAACFTAREACRLYDAEQTMGRALSLREYSSNEATCAFKSARQRCPEILPLHQLFFPLVGAPRDIVERATWRYWLTVEDGATNDRKQLLETRGKAKMSLGDWNGAARDFTAAIDASSSGWISAKTRISDFDGLEEYLRPSAVALSSWFCLRAQCLEKQGDYSNAVKDYTRAIYIRPFSAEPFKLRSAAYSKLRQSDEATRDLDIFKAMTKPESGYASAVEQLRRLREGARLQNLSICSEATRGFKRCLAQGGPEFQCHFALTLLEAYESQFLEEVERKHFQQLLKNRSKILPLYKLQKLANTEDMGEAIEKWGIVAQEASKEVKRLRLPEALGREDQFDILDPRVDRLEAMLRVITIAKDMLARGNETISKVEATRLRNECRKSVSLLYSLARDRAEMVDQLAEAAVGLDDSFALKLLSRTERASAASLVRAEALMNLGRLQESLSEVERFRRLDPECYRAIELENELKSKL